MGASEISRQTMLDALILSLRNMARWVATLAFFAIGVGLLAWLLLTDG